MNQCMHCGKWEEALECVYDYEEEEIIELCTDCLASHDAEVLDNAIFNDCEEC